MNPSFKTMTLSAAAFAAAAFSLSADPVEAALDDAFASLEEAVPGKFSINTRLRYEDFDLENGRQSDGPSIRVRYGYKTPDFNGFTAFVEGETVSRVGGDADDIHFLDDLGDGTDLNQAWVQYANADYGKIKVGRQIIALDDQRFIGHVGWRQNIQVYDAAYGEFTGIDKFTAKAVFIDERHLVNGAHNKTDSFALNGSYAFMPEFKLTGFYYDMEGEDATATTNETVGLRVAGKIKAEEVTLKYAFSFADQSDAGAAENVDSSYYAGDVSALYKGLTLGFGFETLEAGFRTPYATVHKFNGFADVFAIPSLTGSIVGGLDDVYLYAGYTIPVGNGIKTKIAYHWFSADDAVAGQVDEFGEELDLVASYKFNKYFTAVAKYGAYSADSDATHYANDKDMFTFEFNFKY